MVLEPRSIRLISNPIEKLVGRVKLGGGNAGGPKMEAALHWHSLFCSCSVAKVQLQSTSDDPALSSAFKYQSK